MLLFWQMKTAICSELPGPLVGAVAVVMETVSLTVLPVSPG